MKRRAAIVVLVALSAVFGSECAVAQVGVPLIVVLLHGKQSALASRLEALRDGLRDLGYAEGRNLRLEVRWSEGRADRLPALARELLAMKPDVAVGQTVLAAQALYRETKTIPIVIAGGAGAKRLGLIQSLARPGGNVTGAINQLDDLSAKQVELVREFAPRAKRVLALSSGFSAAEPEVRAGTRTAARTYDLTLIEVLADRPEKLAEVAARCERERCEAIVVLLDPVLQNFRPQVVAIAAQLGIPAAYAMLEYVDEGGLVAYSSDVNKLVRRAASHVDKILKGARPQDLPVEQPTQFELVVNQRAARAIGVSIPQSILLRADRVIE